MINYSTKEALEIMKKLPNVTRYKDIDKKITINEIMARINYLITDPEETEKREEFVRKASRLTIEDRLTPIMSQYA